MGPDERSIAGFRRTNNLILRLIAGTYVLAFASLGSQIEGLAGSSGILPAREFLQYLSEHVPAPARFFAHPTVFWLSAGDAWLAGACVAGVLAALAAAAGFAPLASLSACFLLYLSLFTVGGEFLRFQWDILLLEAGFLAVLAAPVRSFRSAAEPPRAAVFLFRLLFFKLIFVSGLCKLASQDPTWRTLTALHFHYETQPLPPWTAWYFHHLPDAFQRLSVLVMFGVELVLPFFIFFGRRARLAAFWGIVFLQLVIVLSGNYGFFNVLTLALGVSLLDDRRLKPSLQPSPPALLPQAGRFRRLAALAACVFIIPASVYLTAVRWIDNVPHVAPLARWVAAPLQSWPIANTYGLFSVMTTQRREIVLEGSADGESWKAYEFRWKPGDPSRRPAFVAPHMPRLDWQMWFAALGTWRQNPWFLRFCRRVLEGEPAVLRLLANNPFPEAPPKYVRAAFYEYRFSEREGRRRGEWWTRRPLGLYVPAMSLDDRKA